MNMSNVIDLETYIFKTDLKKFESAGIISENITQNISLISVHGSTTTRKSYEQTLQEFRNDQVLIINENFFSIKESLLANLKTKNSNFMFPSVLCRYRRGINPVKALYLSLQETILKYDSENDFHNWVLSIFEDDVVYELLLNSVREDMLDMELICIDYDRAEYSTEVSMGIIEIAKMHHEYSAYLDTFSTVRQWKKDNINI